MEEQLFKLVKNNEFDKFQIILDAMPNDNFLSAKLRGMPLIHYIFQFCNWSMIRTLLFHYKKKGIRTIFKHERALSLLWRRGYRSILLELVRIGMDYRTLMELSTSEADFFALLQVVPSPAQFIADYKKFMEKHNLRFDWFREYETAATLAQLHSTKIASKS